jgi:hypothetical protein
MPFERVASSVSNNTVSCSAPNLHRGHLVRAPLAVRFRGLIEVELRWPRIPECVVDEARVGRRLELPDLEQPEPGRTVAFQILLGR